MPAIAPIRELGAIIKSIPKIKGFIGNWIDDPYYGKEYVLANKKSEITFTFHQGGDGTTSFKTTDGHWRTFDRRGVESSFYWKPWDYKGAPKVNLKEMLDEQLQRIAASREYFNTAIIVPEIGFSVSPANLEKLKMTFKNAGYHSFHPSGFGVGYTVSAKPLRFGKKASKELMDFFGVAPLYIATFDAD